MTDTEFNIVIGPQHPALKEPASFLFKVEGETVIDVEPRLGYNHRGIEKAMEARTYAQNLSLVERVCGICSNVHQTNYCLSVEEVAGLQIPERAKWLRTLVHEMERIHSHLLWLGVGAHEIGFDTLFYYVWRDREIVMDLFEEISGNRVNYAWNVIGGVHRDIKNEKIPEYKAKFKVLREATQHYLAVCAAEQTVLDRCSKVGYLSKSDMERLCGVGPHARASGVDRDVRRDHPYLAFPDIPFKVHTSNLGDVLGNVLVRVNECIEATQICEYVLDHLPPGDTKVRFLPLQKVPEGECANLMEAQRGELCHYLLSKGDNKPYRYKIRAPTNANIPSLAEKLKGQFIADIPIILAGIDPCFSCTDRMVFVDEDRHKAWDMDHEQLRKYGLEWYKNGQHK